MRPALSLLLPLMAILAPGTRADVRPGRGPLIGYVHNGTCVASTDASPADFSCSVLVGDLRSAKQPAAYYYHFLKQLQYPYRWRIAHDLFWATSFQVERTATVARFPVADFELFASRDPDVRGVGFAKRYPWDPSLRHQDLDV